MTSAANLSKTAYRPPWWVWWWFVVSTILVAWDTGFVLARPRSFAGGDLHFLWKPYALYEKIDLVYSRSWYDRRDGFTSAQGASLLSRSLSLAWPSSSADGIDELAAMMNIVESVLNVLYLWLAARESPEAVLVGFTGATMTSAKTILYWLRDWVRPLALSLPAVGGAAVVEADEPSRPSLSSRARSKAAGTPRASLSPSPFTRGIVGLTSASAAATTHRGTSGCSSRCQTAHG